MFGEMDKLLPILLGILANQTIQMVLPIVFIWNIQVKIANGPIQDVFHTIFLLFVVLIQQQQRKGANKNWNLAVIKEGFENIRDYI